MRAASHLAAARRRWPLATAVAAVVTTLLLALAPAASAHPYLVASSPQAGVVASSAPTKVQIAFTEGLVLKGSSITITGPDHKTVPIGALQPALGGDAMTASIKKIPEGVYTVNWVAYGNDGHTVEGSFQFGVPSSSGQAPTGASQLLASTTTSGEQAPTESLISVAGRWLAALAAFALLGAATLLLRLRGRTDEKLRVEAQARWLRLAPWALGVALIGTVAEALKRADGANGFDLGLLTAATSGVAIIVRLAVLVVGTGLLVTVLRRAAATVRIGAYGIVGALTLAALAVDGHVSTVRSTPVLADLGMVLHLLSGGIWVGAIFALALCLAPAAVRAGKPGDLVGAARAYAPYAIGAAAVMTVTGVIAAVREVHLWYFLRWSSYGHLLIIKVLVVAAIVAAGATTAVWGRRHPERAGWLVRGEAVLSIVAVALAALLAGTLQGRGQTLPSQRGNLLPGAGFADVALASGTGQMTLAPATVGLNRIIVDDVQANTTGSVAPTPPKSLEVRFACGCSAGSVSFRVALHPGSQGPSGPWSGEVAIPRDGTYTAELVENNKPTVGEPTFTVGDVHTAGSTPVEVASVADLSGPDAADCRSQEIGALISIELMNASGGINGNKIHQVLMDDEGSATIARQDALAAREAAPRRVPGPVRAGCAGGDRGRRRQDPDDRRG